MKHLRLTAATVVLALLGLTTYSSAGLLGSADRFAVLAGASVTNTGPTLLSGDLGVGPSGAITGFGPGVVANGSIHAGDATATQALADAATAYDILAGEISHDDLSGQDLGGTTLLPGVYHFATSAFLTGKLTLDTLGDPNARFDFQIGTTLITSVGSSVHMIGGNGSNVYWKVGSSATLATNTAFAGHVLAFASVGLGTGASILDGSAVARTGAVTLDTNAIVAPVPEPASFLVLSAGVLTLGRRLRRQ